MAFYSDDVERLREIARKHRSLGLTMTPAFQSKEDADFLEEIADKILKDIAEPSQFPWPSTPPEDP